MEGLPLYVQVRNKIKEGIERGVIKPDANGILPGQHQFAEIYKVGLMTVKRAIRDLEQMGLVESRRGKGLMLKSTAPLVEPAIGSAGRMRHIGVAFFDVFKSIGNPVVSRLMSGVEQLARENGIALHIFSFPGLEVSIQEDTLFSNFPFMNLDGMLLLSPVSPGSIAKINERQIPYVSFNLMADEHAICHVSDLVSGPFMVTDAILNRGRKNIVLYAGNQNKISGHTLLSGYKVALNKHGIDFDPAYVCYEDYNQESSINFLKSMFEKGLNIDSVIGFDDVMAARIHDYLISEGRKDVLIAGFGNLDEYKNKVTITVEVSYKEIGYNSAMMLFDMINGVKPKQTKYYYEPSLIERDKNS